MSGAQACDVLVVGLGPVGATLAALLGERGVEVMAIDRSEQVYPLPRAVHFDHEVMRVFQELGLATAVLDHARPAPTYEFRNADGEVLLRFDAVAGRLASSGWTSGYMFNQPGLERALRAKLAASPKVSVRLGAAFEGLALTRGGAEVAVRDPDGPTTVRARYVVGCDGASSLVREAMGAELDDLDFDEPWLVVDVIARPGARLPALNLQICDPARPTTCVQAGPGRHRWEIMLSPGERNEDVLDDAFIRSQIGTWDVDVEIERKAVYRFHGLVARRWRKGPVFLAGDAAHQTPPFAGQGMCAGIRDAANLAWKLAAVVRNEASDTLLESYQKEREPNARAFITLAMNMGRIVCTTDPVRARQRDAQMLATRRAGLAGIPPADPPPHGGPCILAGAPGAGALFPQPVARTRKGVLRLDDHLGPHGWLLGGDPGAQGAAGLEAVPLDDPRLRPFQNEIKAWLTAHGVAAVLVRPDRIVFGTGTPGDLLAAWASALGEGPGASQAGRP